MAKKSKDELSQTEKALHAFVSARIKEAREERGLSQQELARYLYKSQRAVSDMERAHVQINLMDLLIIASALEKPASYFLPPFFTEGREEDFTPDEGELIHFYRQIWDDQLKAIALRQVRSIAEANLEAQKRDLGIDRLGDDPDQHGDHPMSRSVE